MSNSATPTGENGKQEIKLTRSDETEKLIDKFFEDLDKEQYNSLSTRCLIFDVPKENIKVQAGDDDKEQSSLSSMINVLESGKRDFVLEELEKGAGINLKLAELRKVKAKVEKIKKEKVESKIAKAESKKSTAGGNEKSSENRDR
jgi:CO dehydrogenase/acetyl-CoA synthase alpha subunit